jgi:hypothetical protein
VKDGMEGVIRRYRRAASDTSKRFSLSSATINDIKASQGYKCYYSGFPLNNTCLIELKSPDGDYTKENVVLTDNTPWLLFAKDRAGSTRGNIRSAFMRSVRKGAKKRGLVFDITVKTIDNLLVRQNNKCALSGISFLKERFSVDRIDSSIGYTVDNVQLTTISVNLAKQQMSNDEFILLCRRISKNWPSHEKKFTNGHGK